MNYAPSLMPPWVHGAHPMATEAISTTIGSEFKRLMERDGIQAFEMPRSAACAHETGHAIVETVLGARVKSVEIHTCRQLRKLGVSNAWGGKVLCHDDNGWAVFPDTPDIEVRHRVYRMIAGVVAEEVLDPDNLRSGSSLDERAVAQVLCISLHEREGREGHPSETWRDCWKWVRATIKHNEAVGRQLMARLDAVERLKGKPLNAILRRVVAP